MKTSKKHLIFLTLLLISLSNCNKYFIGPSGAEGELLEPGGNSTGFNADVPYNLSIDGKVGTAYFNAYPTYSIILWQTHVPENIQYYEIDMNMDQTPDATNNIQAYMTYDLIAPNFYAVKVRSVNYSGNRSAWSAPLNIFYDNAPPSVITLFNVLPLGGGWVRIQWNPSNDGLSGTNYYQITLIYNDTTPKTTSILMIRTDPSGNITSDPFKILVVDPTKSNVPDLIDNENPGWIQFNSTDYASGMFDIQIKLKFTGNYDFSALSYDNANNKSTAITLTNKTIN